MAHKKSKEKKNKKMQQMMKENQATEQTMKKNEAPEEMAKEDKAPERRSKRNRKRTTKGLSFDEELNEFLSADEYSPDHSSSVLSVQCQKGW